MLGGDFSAAFFRHRLPSAVQRKSPLGLETVLGEIRQRYFTLRATDSRYAAPETPIAQEAEDRSAAPDLRCTELSSGIRKWPRSDDPSCYETPATALSAARPRSLEAGCSLPGSAPARQL